MTVRKIDELGRIVLPKELRNELGWEEHTALEIKHLKDVDMVLLRRHRSLADACTACGKSGAEFLVRNSTVHLCRKCKNSIEEN